MSAGMPERESLTEAPSERVRERMESCRVQSYPAAYWYVEDVSALAYEIFRLKNIIECADTPMMRDVLAERDTAYRAMRQMVSACGIPDAAEACRMVIGIYRGTPPGQEEMNRGRG